MHAESVVAVPRRRSAFALTPSLAALLFAASLSPAPPAQAQILGQWSPLQPTELSGIPIHMALVPGDGAPYHSRVVWTGYDGGTPSGGVLGWTPDGDPGCAFPDQVNNLVPLAPLGANHDLFCGTQLTLGDGRLASFGGTSRGYFGLDSLFTYPRRMTGSTPGAWAAAASAKMSEQRWYPSATLLRTAPPTWPGRVLVSAGTKYNDFWFFGGRRDGQQPTVANGGRKLERSGRVDGGSWDPSLETEAHPLHGHPDPREEHSLVNIPALGGPMLFGGNDGDGNVDDQDDFAWILIRESGEHLAPDYTYRWGATAVSGPPFPDPRTEHTALAVSDDAMVVFGGVDDPSGVDQAFWLFSKDAFGAWRWDRVFLDPGSAPPPPARYGHTAVYDEHDFGGSHGIVRRMILYGGAPTLNGTVTDTKVYVFTFSGSGFTSGTWSEANPGGGPPALYDHAMALSPHPWAGPPGRRIAWVYGGTIGNTSNTSDVLWRLVLSATDPAGFLWESASPADPNTSPGGRVGHTMLYDPQTALLCIVGGSTANPPDRHIYQVKPQPVSSEWMRGEQSPVALAGHAVAYDPNVYKVTARIPEVYDPQANTWTMQPAAARAEDYYPLQFLVPRVPHRADSCRVVVVGPSRKFEFLDIHSSGPLGPWKPIGSSQPSFEPYTAAMYAPGRILTAGGLAFGSNPVVQTALTLDTDEIYTGIGYQQTNAMVHKRIFHNLVVLPTGGVLAIGGWSNYTDGYNWDPADAVIAPERWDPVTRGWQTWSSSGAVPRNYHQCAILLPDARILQGGGWYYNKAKTVWNPNWKKLQLFCPPYLFKSDGTTPATRPVISSAPDTIRWQQVFSVCVDDPATISAACLIRPAATTHGFDPNQRFVPLTLNGYTGSGAPGDPKRLFLTAPASPDSAPTGDYMLFVLGSADGPQVPSVARWVALQADPVDWCDVAPPGTIADLTPDIVGPGEIWFTWTAPADDGVLPPSGPAQSFDLRGHTIPLDNPIAWSQAAFQSADESAPAGVGTWGSGHIAGLSPCTSYHFGVRARDDHSQDGGFASATFQTSCDGGGSGFSARESREEGAGALGAAPPATGGGASTGGVLPASGVDRDAAVVASAASLGPTTGLLVAETRREGTGAWRITLHLRETPGGSDPQAATITVEPDGAGGPADTLGRFEPRDDHHLLGLCALRDRGRLGVPGVYRIERVEPGLRTRTGDHRLVGAVHGRNGPLDEEFLLHGGAVEMVPGDSLVLAYEPAAGPLPHAADWYVLARRASDAPPTPMTSRRGRSGETPPVRFALHPNRPNPFRGTTVIAFDLPVASPVNLAVFDLLGRRVATLAEGPHAAGSHAVEWDLRGAAGAHITPGVYICRLEAGDFRARRKMSLAP